MKPVVRQEPGSNQIQTITRFDLRTAKDYYKLGEFLASTIPNFWPPERTPYGHKSVDQEGSWRGECARIINAGGIILMTHISLADSKAEPNLVGVCIGAPSGVNDREMEIKVNVAAYDAENLRPAQRNALIDEAKDSGWILGQPMITRVWVPLKKGE